MKYYTQNKEIGQGRAGIRWKSSQLSRLIIQSVENSQKIPGVPKIEKEVINKSSLATPVQSICNPKAEVINRRMMQEIIKDIPFYPEPVYQTLSQASKNTFMQN